MRIISKFQDYYDCLQNYQDKNLVYIRKETYDDAYRTEESSASEFSSVFGQYTSSYYSRITDYRFIVVGFCGKLYEGIHFRTGPNYATLEDIYCYDADSTRDFLTDNVPQKDWDKAYKGRNFFNKRTSGPNMFDNSFKLSVNDSSRLMHLSSLFQEKKVPIFVSSRKGIIFNTSLRNIQFYKVFDTFQCFQELEMYIGGVLGNANPPIPEISNDDMIVAKGFDLKFSFRKEKRGS